MISPILSLPLVHFYASRDYSALVNAISLFWSTFVRSTPRFIFIRSSTGREFQIFHAETVSLLCISAFCSSVLTAINVCPFRPGKSSFSNFTLSPRLYICRCLAWTALEPGKFIDQSNVNFLLFDASAYAAGFGPWSSMLFFRPLLSRTRNTPGKKNSSSKDASGKTVNAPIIKSLPDEWMPFFTFHNCEGLIFILSAHSLSPR